MLREFSGEDASGLYKVYGDAEATRHLSFEPKDMKQVSAVVQSAMTSATANLRTEYMLAIADAGSGELVGAARLALGEYQSAQIGFALRPDQWVRAKAPRRCGYWNTWGSLSWGCTESGGPAAQSTKFQTGLCVRPGWSRRVPSGGICSRGARGETR